MGVNKAWACVWQAPQVLLLCKAEVYIEESWWRPGRGDTLYRNTAGSLCCYCEGCAEWGTPGGVSRASTHTWLAAWAHAAAVHLM